MYFDSDDSDGYSSPIEVGVYDDDLIQAEGIHATIYRVDVTEEASPLPGQDNVPGLRAVKSVSAFKNARLEPHDIRTEAYALSRLRHNHVVELFGASYCHRQKLFQLSMPFIPLTLNDILENPNCSPYFLPKPEQALKGNLHTLYRFSALSKSLIYQVTTAVAFLHTHIEPIAHRDLKPSNVLVQPDDGCIKLCDFGISWDGRPRGNGASLEEPRGNDVNGRLNVSSFFDSEVPRPEWDESSEHMCCQVSSGPYRAPELLFAPRQYDAYATDLWSLGVLASNFFTSLRFDLYSSQPESGPEEFDWDALVMEGGQQGAHNELFVPQLDPTIPFNLPATRSGARRGDWHRMHIFDSTRGEIGLVASIFKLLGTPTEANWPGFHSLPAASALVFNPVSPRALGPLLPNLVQTNHPALTGDLNSAGSSNDIDWGQESENAIQLIQALVRYPPQSRTSASNLLGHPYFTKGQSLVLPSVCAKADSDNRGPGRHKTFWDANTLAGLITQVLAPESNELDEVSNLS